MRTTVFRQRSVLPGFGLTLGYTVFYLCLIVLLPLSALFLRSATMGWDAFFATMIEPRVLAAFRLTFLGALFAAAINTVFGFVAAWTLVRYSFPAKKWVDAMVDLPFALPTAVSGIALTAIYAPNGWLGSLFEAAGVKVAFASFGVLVAMTFIGLPFVVRTLQPALEDLETEMEDAAASLGATRGQTLVRVILPTVLPSLLTGFALAFARAVGEYGSIVFISGNMPMKTEVVSLLIVSKPEQYDYAGAAAIAVVMLLLSFLVLLAVNGLQWWSGRRRRTVS